MSADSHSRSCVTVKVAACAAALLAASGAARAEHPCDVFGDGYVKVIVDMDPDVVGCQCGVTLPAGATVAGDVAVWVFDPLERQAWGIGYLGGIDRGISFGHMPANAAIGAVTDVSPTAGQPINPGSTIWIAESPGLDPGFAGPEVQYTECCASQTAPIPSAPSQPVFTADILLSDVRPGDVFHFYLLDFVAVWSAAEFGAFSTRGQNSLDSGGDVVPDGTQTIHGVDPDTAVPSPPAAFLVDYVDAQGDAVAATVTIVARPGDMNVDGQVSLADMPGFIDVLIGADTDPIQVSLGDMDRDAHTDGADICGFVDALTAP